MAVFPCYLVIGRMLAAAPEIVRVAVFMICAVMLTLFSAMFAAWYRVF
jgi:hypothetical protein